MLQALQKKVNVVDKNQVVAPKEEVQAKPESKKETEDAVKPGDKILRLQFPDKTVKQIEAQPANYPTLKCKKAWLTILKTQ